jgi:hypothetical protein
MNLKYCIDKVWESYVRTEDESLFAVHVSLLQFEKAILAASKRGDVAKMWNELVDFTKP